MNSNLVLLPIRGTNKDSRLKIINKTFGNDQEQSNIPHGSRQLQTKVQKTEKFLSEREWIGVVVIIVYAFTCSNVSFVIFALLFISQHTLCCVVSSAIR